MATLVGLPGAFNVEIGGLAPGSDFYRFTSTNLATLSVSLNISLVNGFMPSVGQTFG